MPEEQFEVYCNVKFAEIDNNLKKINDKIDDINQVLVTISSEQVTKKKNKRTLLIQIAEIIIFIVGFVISLVLRNK